MNFIKNVNVLDSTHLGIRNKFKNMESNNNKDKPINIDSIDISCPPLKVRHEGVGPQSRLAATGTIPEVVSSDLFGSVVRFFRKVFGDIKHFLECIARCGV
jgi:restriction endonuclease S subunit